MGATWHYSHKNNEYEEVPGPDQGCLWYLKPRCKGIYPAEKGDIGMRKNCQEPGQTSESGQIPPTEKKKQNIKYKFIEYFMSYFNLTE